MCSGAPGGVRRCVEDVPAFVEGSRGAAVSPVVESLDVPVGRGQGGSSAEGIRAAMGQ